MITVSDFFCGAGGSSTGAVQVPGVRVELAANHWKLAVDSHSANHPGARHDIADLSQVDPRRYPKTDIAWLSPSCTNHSIAKGARRSDQLPDLFGDVLPDEAAERSRATMWDVIRFAEHHRYRAIIVENVVDAAAWVLWPAWSAALTALGYEYRLVSLNSMHAAALGPAAPQSRDRMYVVAWRTGERAPDLNRWARPIAECPQHGRVRAIQAWRREGRTVGKYKSQYVWRCPRVECRNTEVRPQVRPAADIIDWALPAARITDRPKPLAAKTMKRIREGFAAYTARPLVVPVEGREGKKARPADEPLRTCTARNETGLAYMVELRGGGSKHRPVSEPLATVCASGNHHGLVSGKAIAASVEQMRFRMLSPDEYRAAMAFPGDYVLLGTRRERVRMAGNAVTPPAARDLIAAVAESITGEQIEPAAVHAQPLRRAA
ncbi:DNA cytosine methyltransferase [Nocardiopsis sp. CNT-189]|uniref:DNA cytosine methyltransferase n=1 Tax=Nocardiopsis oceanisediminis TaxID=2816862 RepID=UPI003B2D616F